MRPSVVRAFLAVLVLSSRLNAQAPPPELPVIGDSIDVRVVNIEAVVTDASGQRVHGLGPHDLRLRIDGKEASVEFFNEIRDGRANAMGEANGDPVARNYLVYLDDSFSLGIRRNAVLDRLERDLSLLQPADRMAILAFDGSKIDVLSDWTANQEQLRAALALARQRPTLGNKELASKDALQRDVDWATGCFDKDQGDQLAAVLEQLSHRIPLEARTQLGRTSTAIAATLGGLTAPSGRKVLLYLTGAWSLEILPRLFFPLVAVANQAGYTVYPIDTAMSDAVEISDIDGFAKATGGRALVSASDEVFRLAVADSGSYYWLGFTPTWKGDDRGHSIVVEPLRPGLQVRTRLGFVDTSVHTQVALQARRLLLFDGANEDKRLIVELGAEDRAPGEPAGRKAKTIKVPLTLGVPVESLLLRPEGTGYVAELPLAIKAEDTKLRQSDLPPLRLRVLLSQKPKGGTFARFHTVLELRNVAQRLVFTVQDPFSGHPVWGQASIQPSAPNPVGRSGRDW